MSYGLYTVATTLRSNNSGKTSAFTFDIPPGYYIAQIIVTNNTANAITGGLKFGSTLGGADVILAQAVIATAVVNVVDASFLKRRFAKGVTQTVFVDAVTAWNSANVDVDVVLVRYI